MRPGVEIRKKIGGQHLQEAKAGAPPKTGASFRVLNAVIIPLALLVLLPISLTGLLTLKMGEKAREWQIVLQV